MSSKVELLKSSKEVRKQIAVVEYYCKGMIETTTQLHKKYNYYCASFCPILRKEEYDHIRSTLDQIEEIYKIINREYDELMELCKKRDDDIIPSDYLCECYNCKILRKST